MFARLGWFLLAVHALVIVAVAQEPPVASKEPLRRIAFGSCARQDKPQPIWDVIAAARPDVFLFLGDNIYGDTNDMTVLKSKYDQLAAIPSFAKFRKQFPILATWDDHDYGQNDAGVEYPQKRESQALFLDFFGVPSDSPRRQQEGVYSSALYGPEGQRTQVILLDTRYFRSPLKPMPGQRSRYVPDDSDTVTMLGDAQWQWLEAQLRQPAELRIIASSIQVIAEDHPFEKWMNFPKERARLLKLIRDTGAKGVVFLSGDRHLAEISMLPSEVGYPLYDVTASGLTEAAPRWRPQEPNRHRVGTMNYGNHFGFIHIDWYASDPQISLQIRDEAGEVIIQQKLRLSWLGSSAERRSAAATPARPVSEGCLTTADAAKKVGEEVTVEMDVQATGGSGSRTFLNSDSNFRSDANFTIVIERSVLPKFAEAGVENPREFYKNKRIQVKGKVEEFQGRPQIKVTDPGQVRVVAP
jgi:alkaline phosphatase D